MCTLSCATSPISQFYCKPDDIVWMDGVDVTVLVRQRCCMRAGAARAGLCANHAYAHCHISPVPGMRWKSSAGHIRHIPIPFLQVLHTPEMGIGSRGLLDTAEPAAAASITVVTNASQLQAAVASRAQDIEIRSHLDLSELGLLSGYTELDFATALGAIQESRSIRVRRSCMIPAARSQSILDPRSCNNNSIKVLSQPAV